MEINATCKICGQTYIKRNGRALYCSDGCKREATRQRQKAWREAHPDYLKEWRSTHGGNNEQEC